MFCRIVAWFCSDVELTDGQKAAIDRAKKRRYTGHPSFNTYEGVEFVEFWKANRRASFCTQCDDGDTTDGQWRMASCVSHAKRHKPAEPASDEKQQLQEQPAQLLGAPAPALAHDALAFAAPALPFADPPLALAFPAQAIADPAPAQAPAPAQPANEPAPMQLAMQDEELPAAPNALVPAAHPEEQESERKHRGIRTKPQPFFVDPIVEVLELSGGLPGLICTL